MKNKLIMLFAIISALVLEILPYGAVCVFALDEGERLRQTFSYFDLTPFGYANFSPFIVALLTCAVFILIIVYMSAKKPLTKPIFVLSSISCALSLAPLLFGVDFFSVTGAIICALLLVTAVTAFITGRREK